ncbi:TetR/AcrR family transcriptional regulator [Saccharopolyspora phatthalungensis]|uniref:AcrR family transcriptional regulator n=1 Tax=Saccharopolyspora phatthalungensis TaxID=664693 RepID=A0A840Q5E2_9PSEU|nr:TetR/AcrR family transcriptional regulator [Saccharopolyspora phatthalungensis]MBB5157722.1 AcrR family transcriptional regulator [Saccharopolyspora phatthalungensis]
MAEVTNPPARNTRPRNRRALITAAAADLFYRLGYARVGMSDIAEAVGVGSSALYRHFAGKQQLLIRVVLDELHPFSAIAAQVTDRDLDEVVAELAAAALDHRQLGVLWQREARHLPDEQRDLLREELRGVASGLAEVARAFQPELTGEDARFRAWCMFSVLTSPSYHQVDLPRREFEQLLRAMVVVIGRQPPQRFADRRAADSDQRSALFAGRASRRRLLLSAAMRLFSDAGYTKVTTEDVGAAAGIAGPSLYNYFASKQELLGTVITRGNAWLEVELERTLANTPAADDALRELLRSYITFAFDHGRFIDILVSEVNHLPDAERHRARQTQHAYVAEWVGLLCEARPELDPVRSRILVQAALTAANDMARTGAVRDVDALLRIGSALMLDTPVTDVRPATVNPD